MVVAAGVEPALAAFSTPCLFQLGYATVGVKWHLSERELLMRQGTIVDATIIAAAPSTKNAQKQRDPEMHQTRKGQQWYCGMKAHIGVDADSGLVHTVIGTAANVSDIACAGPSLARRGKDGLCGCGLHRRGEAGGDGGTGSDN